MKKLQIYGDKKANEDQVFTCIISAKKSRVVVNQCMIQCNQGISESVTCSNQRILRALTSCLVCRVCGHGHIDRVYLGFEVSRTKGPCSCWCII